MTDVDRTARIRWSPLSDGVQRFTVGSHSFPAIDVDIDPEADVPVATSPAELLAGAVGSIFLWQVAQALHARTVKASELTAYVTIHFTDRPTGEDRSAHPRGARLPGKVGVELRGRIDGVSQEDFSAAAQSALDRCVEILSMSAAKISVNAILEPS